jgi:hypothetical protein
MEKRMKYPSSSLPAAAAADTTATAGATWALRVHAAQPARFLGPKASALQLRRQQRELHRPFADDMLVTADAAMSFAVRLCGRVLYVERLQRRPLGVHIVQSMVFDNDTAFSRWCDAEPLRFDDPSLHQRLRRRGQELFGGSA